MRRTIERIRAKLAKRKNSFLSIFAGIITVGCLSVLLSQVNIVSVSASQAPVNSIVESAVEQPENLLLLTGIETGINDEISHAGNTEEGTNLQIDRTFNVNLWVEGSVLTSEVTEGTVADFLALHNITLGEHDIVTPSLDTMLLRDMEITINRVSYRETSRRVEVTNEKLAEYKETLPPESLSSFVVSKSRIYDVVYLETIVDGEVTNQELVDLKAVYHPYDAPSGGFKAGVPVSTIDAFDGIELGEDGLPTTYSRKISGAVTTAYSASAGRGAGGQGLYCGTVAVNPAVIPYGTRLFITSANGNFVYGYAIASDTGTALQSGHVDIDLYFESNAECNQFGKRALDVYILD